MQATIVTQVRCSATDHGGLQCSRLTRYGPLCPQHADALLGLEVAPSGIPSGGMGLFTTRNMDRDHIIDVYRGALKTDAAFKKRPSHYGLEVTVRRGNQRRKMIIDPIRSTDCFARYANDARTSAGTNSWFESEYHYWKRIKDLEPDFWRRNHPRKPAGSTLLLVSTRGIPAGKEIFADYGDEYWAPSDEEESEEEEETVFMPPVRRKQKTQ